MTTDVAPIKQNFLTFIPPQNRLPYSLYWPMELRFYIHDLNTCEDGAPQRPSWVWLPHGQLIPTNSRKSWHNFNKYWPQKCSISVKASVPLLHIFRERLNIQIYLIMGEASHVSIPKVTKSSAGPLWRVCKLQLSLISYLHNKEFLEFVRDRDAITLNDAIY